MSLPRLRGTRERYAELDDSSVVLIPAKPTSVLLPEHFCEPLSQLRYPVRLDFSHERFRLRSMQALSQLKDTALVDIDLSDNELRSISELNRFPALKSLVASRNALESGPGVALAVHRLTRLDLSGNQLTVVPTLKELPLLQILNLSRNLIRDGWEEIGRCQGLQALDVSENAFDWSAETGELRRAMAVLRGLKRLRVLNLSHTPAASQRGYRGWVVANARKLELLDDAPVTEAERMGEDDKNSALDDDASSVASSAVASSWLSGFSGVSSRSTQREKPEGGRYSSAAAPAASSAAPSAAAPGHTLAPTFGRDVELILRREGGLLPRLVQECTRHVQERTGGEAGRVPAGTALTAEGHPSAVLALRHAFEISPERGIAALRESVVPSGGSSGDDDESELRDGDVRASCSLLRAFLIELPQPLIPNELFLPLLETTKAWAPTVVEHRQHEVSASHGSLGWSLDGLPDGFWMFCSDGFWMFCIDGPWMFCSDGPWMLCSDGPLALA
jgi:hypothetical protein